MTTMKMLVLATVALLAGCAAETGNEESGEDSDAVGSTAQAFSVTSYKFDLPYRGGTGGPNAGRVSCNAGSAAVGIYGTTGNFVNELGLVCAPVRSDGTLGPRYTTGVRGAHGPNDFMMQCPAGSVISELFGASGTYVDSIGAMCWDVKARKRSTWSGTYYGGSGGNSYFNDECPSDYGVTSVYVRYGSWIDAIRGTCSYLDP